jgi:hypothetical protein
MFTRATRKPGNLLRTAPCSEDNLYLEKGVMAKNSGEQVEKIVRIAREHGLEPVTPDEAREILGLKGMGNVKY